MTALYLRMSRFSCFCLLLSGAALPLAACGAPPPIEGDAHAVAIEEDRQISKLIGELGDDRFVVRQRAQRELTRLGPAAFDALSAAEDSDDVEIATQARYLVHLIRIDWAQESDSPEAKAKLHNYEYGNEQERLDKMKALAALSNDEGIGPLCRLARFEASHVLSKQAAALVLHAPAASGEDWAKRSRTILATADRGTRPAAAWLRTYVLAHDDPASALPLWRQLATAEQDTLEHHPQLTQNSVLEELFEQQVDALDRLGRGAEAEAIVRGIIDLDRGESDSLTELVNWLSGRKDWKAVEEVAKRFENSFAGEPDLLYTLAQARLASGNEALARETAQQALKLNPDKPLEHLQVALRLQYRGMIDWADGEYRYLIGLGWGNGVVIEVGLLARIQLSENLHDRLQNKEAGEVLEEAVKMMDSDINILRAVQRLQKLPHEVRARALFFLAEDMRRRGDNAKALEFVEKALTESNTDVDALICMYRLPLDPERRKKLLETIHQAVDENRRLIQQHPDEDKYYNLLAWLVANTEGDIDEAIRMSHKSIELRHAGGYLDTLAHCYHAKGDYASAVKYQTEAAQLDPGSVAIGRQLKVFRAALDKQTQEAGAKGAEKAAPSNKAAPSQKSAN